jgi:hypothetical protein
MAHPDSGIPFPKLSAFEQAQLEGVAKVVYESLVSEVHKALETSAKILETMNKQGGDSEANKYAGAVLILMLSLQGSTMRANEDLKRFGPNNDPNFCG